jgi:hypothetical protein
MASSQRLVALGTTAGGGVTGCVVFFLWNVWSAMGTEASRQKRVITYLGTFILYIVFGSVGLSAAGLLLYVVQTNPQNKKGQQSATVRRYGVTIEVSGRRVTTETGGVVPFRASSGQVNFGCEQTISTNAVWQMPSGGVVQGEVRAEWANVANTKSMLASAAVEPGRVVGSGSITGLDVQRIPLGFGSVGNCPGGGHGELIVFGSYVTQRSGEQRFVESLSGTIGISPDEARRLRLTLPTASDVRLDVITVSVRRGEEVLDTARVTLNGTEKSAPVQSEKGLFTASVDHGEVEVILAGQR